MKPILTLLLLTFSLRAADVTVTITIPDARQAQILAAIDSWMAKQTIPDPADPAKTKPKYANRQALLKSILADGLKRILDASPTTAIQTKLDEAAAAKAQAEALREQAVQ